MVGAKQFLGSLPRGPTAPWLARRAIEEWFGGFVSDSELGDIRLLTSELVTNAVVHGTGQITLSGELDDDRVLIEVVDEGHGFQASRDHRALAGDGGHGLMIVDSRASRWGIHEGTTHVWFELERAQRG